MSVCSCPCHTVSVDWISFVDLNWVVAKFKPRSIPQVTVSKDDTIILDGGGDKAIIEDRTEQVQ